MDKALLVFEQLKEANIDIDTVTQKLEDEGIDKFNTAYDQIIGSIKKKKAEQIA
jgi:transaldolase/transaldolase/glucose-6-phosphate isomerase